MKKINIGIVCAIVIALMATTILAHDGVFWPAIEEAKINETNTWYEVKPVITTPDPGDINTPKPPIKYNVVTVEGDGAHKVGWYYAKKNFDAHMERKRLAELKVEQANEAIHKANEEKQKALEMNRNRIYAK